MKRFPKILAATCAAIALSSSLALAAEPMKNAVPTPATMPYGGVHGQHGGMGPMMGPLAQLSPEKQQAARKLMAENAKILFPLHQSLYAKYAELEAVNAAGDGESGKAKSVIRDIADLNAKMLVANSKFRAQMFKETGLRVPVMGHGMMGMGGMMGGKGMCGEMMGGMRGGMMGGRAPMSGPMGGMMGGQMAAPAAQDDAADATAHDAHVAN